METTIVEAEFNKSDKVLVAYGFLATLNNLGRDVLAMNFLYKKLSD